MHSRCMPAVNLVSFRRFLLDSDTLFPLQKLTQSFETQR